MHTLKKWRVLPPAGADVTLGGLASALGSALRDKGRDKGHGEDRENRSGKRQNSKERLKDSLRHMTGMAHIFLYGSGREALARLLAALRKENPGRDMVLLPAYGSFTLPAAVARAGCRVGLYDLEPGTLAPRPDSLHLSEGSLAGRVLAVIACHHYGFPIDFSRLALQCRAAGAVLVDDAAQALGARIGSRPAGSTGDVGLFSFGRGKNICAVSGGVLAVRDSALAQLLEEHAPEGDGSGRVVSLTAQALALRAMTNPALYRVPVSLPWLHLGESRFDPGFPMRPFTDFQAGLALDGLRRLDRLNAGRRETASSYAAWLHGSENLRLIAPQRDAQPVFPRFPILSLLEEGHAPFTEGARHLGISPSFPLPLHRVPDLAPHLAQTEAERPLEYPSAHPTAYPGAEFLAKHLFTLPTHAQVTPRDRRAVLRHLGYPNAASAREEAAAL